jgi:hypothetical protein
MTFLASAYLGKGIESISDTRSPVGQLLHIVSGGYENDGWQRGTYCLMWTLSHDGGVVFFTVGHSSTIRML